MKTPMRSKEHHYEGEPILVGSASYEGLAYPCSCGDCFENREELDQHLREHPKLPSLIEWYRILRAHRAWGIFESMRFALWLWR